MTREFVPFDTETIRKELRALTDMDRAKLLRSMERYEESGFGNHRPALVENYGSGIKRIRHESSEGQGRCLFCEGTSTRTHQKLVMLIVYKKESDAVPSRILSTAKARMRDHRRDNP